MYMYPMPALFQTVYIKTETVPAHKLLTFWLAGQAEKKIIIIHISHRFTTLWIQKNYEH